MSQEKTGKKGLKTEEMIRAYFLRAGFYVVRGVILQVEGDDLTDIDLWVYERSATLARRRIVIDIKDKKTPQAAERLFFVKGLAEALRVEGAGVVTTDCRQGLRIFAHKNGIIWIDGNDLQRLKSKSDLLFPDRLTEEELLDSIISVDSARQSKIFRDGYENIKSSVAVRFGPACANRALEEGKSFCHESVAAHPNTATARLAGRLAYLAASIAAAALDFAAADTALRPAPDRIKYFTDSIRYGDDAAGTQQKLRWAEAAIREYLPNGAGLSQTIREKFNGELKSVPAEALAEIVVKLTKTDSMFSIAKHLEMAAFLVNTPAYDQLPLEVKSFFGAVLDFYGISREAFANAWSPASKVVSEKSVIFVNESIASDKIDSGEQISFLKDR